jgi:hypothetical protein
MMKTIRLAIALVFALFLLPSSALAQCENASCTNPPDPNYDPYAPQPPRAWEVPPGAESLRCPLSVTATSNIVSFWTGGTFLPADIIQAGCTSIEIVAAVGNAWDDWQYQIYWGNHDRWMNSVAFYSDWGTFYNYDMVGLFFFSY